MPRVALLFCVILAGCAFWINKPNDPETLGYVDWVVSNLTSEPDAHFYEQQAAPELLAQFSGAQFTRMAGALTKNLGRFVAYHDATGTTRQYTSPQRGISEAGQYVATADYANGSTTIDVYVIKLNGKWKLSGYHVNLHLK